MKKMKSFMEGIGKKNLIKGFYRNFLTLKGKFHHPLKLLQSLVNAYKNHKKINTKIKHIFRLRLWEMTLLRIIFSKIIFQI